MTKHFQVIKATTRDVDLQIDGKRIELDKNGVTEVTDPGVAREIEARYGKRGGDIPGAVAVAERQVLKSNDGGHRYFFTVPELPWKREVNNDPL